MTNPFDDFPKYTDWFVGEKSLAWRKRHEAEILEIIDKLDAVREVAPEVILAFQELEEQASLNDKYKIIHQKVMEVMKSLLEDDEEVDV